MGVLWEPTAAPGRHRIRSRGYVDSQVTTVEIETFQGNDKTLEMDVAKRIQDELNLKGRPRRIDIHVFTRIPARYALRVAEVGDVPPLNWWNWLKVPPIEVARPSRSRPR